MIKPLRAPLACLSLLLPAWLACARGGAVEDLVPEHSFQPLEAALAQLQPASAPATLRVVPSGGAPLPLSVRLEEVFGQEAQRAPRLRFQVEARWDGTLSINHGAGLDFRATACSATSSPEVPELQKTVCDAPRSATGGPDSLGASWLTRLGASPLATGQELTLDLGQVQQGEGTLALQARVRHAGQTAQGHPVARIELSGSGKLAARPDKAFSGVLAGQVTGLALAEFGPGGDGLVRLQGVTWLDWHGQVRGADGQVADELHQVQSISASWAR